LKDKSILIIDDVRTSGISILECTSILNEKQVKDVKALVLGTNTNNPPQ